VAEAVLVTVAVTEGVEDRVAVPVALLVPVGEIVGLTVTEPVGNKVAVCVIVGDIVIEGD
jgi:hypothetical protein